MDAFVRGQVVVLPFPFSNLETKRWRPVLVLANLSSYNDLIVCMITAKPSDCSIEITESDFVQGKLNLPRSYVRPDRLFTAASTSVERQVGKLTSSKVKEILNEVSRIFSMDERP